MEIMPWVDGQNQLRAENQLLAKLNLELYHACRLAHSLLDSKSKNADRIEDSLRRVMNLAEAFQDPRTLGLALQWISALDGEDRQLMAKELMDAYRKATRDGSWSEFDNTLHEWSESGWAGLNKTLISDYNEAVKTKTPA